MKYYLKAMWNQRDLIRENIKKIDEEVDSQVNGLSKNNNVAVEKLTQNKDVSSVENTMNNE